MSDSKRHNLDNYKPKPNKDWQLHWLDDQPMLYSKSNDSLHLLNPVAGFIWTCCDGKTEVRAIRDALQEVFVDNEVDEDLADILLLWHSYDFLLTRTTGDLPLEINGKPCIWMAWTGENPKPAYLNLCLETVRKHNAKYFEIILITPNNIANYLTDIHPAYQYLSYVHRADYIRCEILHQRGGIYLDMDTICFKDLWQWYDKLQDYDIVNYDGRPWGTLIGTSIFGPTRRNSIFTRAWSKELRKHLDKRLMDLIFFRKMNPEPITDCLQWSEILHFLVVPIVQKLQKNKQFSFYRISLKNFCVTSLGGRYCETKLFKNQPINVKIQTDILILHNSGYQNNFKNLSKQQILSSSLGIASLLQYALS